MKKNVWFITGASKGLGLSLAKKLLKEGFKVAATSRDVKSLVKNIGEQNENFLPLEVDLLDEKSIQAAVQKTIEKFKSVDFLVNNAGYGQGGTVEETTDLEVRKNYEVNVFGTLNVIRNILPYMRNQKSGHIFNISSIGGYVSGFSGWGIYCSTKFAVAGLTEALYTDVKDFGINVTLIYPGYFRTNFLDKDSLVLPSKPIADYVDARKSLDYHMTGINQNQAGDPEKAAVAMITLAQTSNPPLHMFLGSDAYGRAVEKMQAFSSEVQSWEKLSHSTDF